MKGKVELLGMEFRAFHGCLPEERRDGNRFTVDFSCEYDMEAAAASDALEDALNYADIYDIVATQMAQPSNLLENVAARIAHALADAFPQAVNIRVRLAKANPPVAGPVQWSSVTIEL